MKGSYGNGERCRMSITVILDRTADVGALVEKFRSVCEQSGIHERCLGMNDLGCSQNANFLSEKFKLAETQVLVRKLTDAFAAAGFKKIRFRIESITPKGEYYLHVDNDCLSP